MAGFDYSSKSSRAEEGAPAQLNSVMYLPEMDHVGIIVKDADKAAMDMETRFGAKIINRETIEFPKVIYKGNRLSYSAYFVFVDMGNTKIGFIQPDFNVPSPYLDILNEKGEYAHHFCFLVKSTQEYIEKFRVDNPGMRIIAEAQAQSAKGGDMVYIEGVIPGILIELATLIE